MGTANKIYHPALAFNYDKFRSDLKVVKNFARDFKLPFVVR